MARLISDLENTHSLQVRLRSMSRAREGLGAWAVYERLQYMLGIWEVREHTLFTNEVMMKCMGILGCMDCV